MAASLRDAGLRRSRVRDIVVEEFFAAAQHMSVEALLDRVRKRAPETGLSTVYRTLKVLVEHGFAAERDFGGAHTLFEPADTPHHDHAVCVACGRVIEFEDDALEAIQARVASSLGFEVTAHRLELYGRCPSCRAHAAR
ncbi:transcriptional repressor [Anaeromyxobacter diazotrophicus]|uniref:Ferric uptake regulation protein n=1 Tax=Anaeromyxobacter diazotrophicus TaxID=2590199 RepID=A0A7I9VNN1_9BACT|nr:transcriptional repressor [Anaeromyxobacter diazotrophicus]